MDFTLDEDLVALQTLARAIFADRASTDRVRAVETSETRVDEELWRALATSGLTGLAVPEAHGGAGLGPAALAVVLEEQGRTVAPVPLWPAALAALLLGEEGDRHAGLLTGLADGTSRLTVALEEYGAADPLDPRASASGGADGWRLSGVKAAVPTPLGAAHVLVSAATDEGPRLFLVATDAPGVTWHLSPVTTHDLAGELVLDGAPGEPVGGPAAVADAVRLGRVLLGAVQLGVAEGALALAAAYLAEREQFGRPLGSFQAVQHQLADCWIDIDAMRVTLWQAISDAEEASAAADASALVASWWRAQAGLDVVHRVQHVHGGIGVDVDYPVHRFFLWGKQLAGTLGGPAALLAELGDTLADLEVGA